MDVPLIDPEELDEFKKEGLTQPGHDDADEPLSANDCLIQSVGVLWLVVQDIADRLTSETPRTVNHRRHLLLRHSAMSLRHAEERRPS